MDIFFTDRIPLRWRQRLCQTPHTRPGSTLPKRFIRLFLMTILSCTAALANLSHAYDCSALADFTPGHIATGDTLQHQSFAYECLVGGWCQQGGPYEPGVGWAYTTAWQDLGECSSEFNQAPVVEFSLPDSIANGTELHIQGVIYDPDGLVQRRRIIIDGEPKGELHALYGIFDIDYRWRPALGYHTFTVEIEDDLGAITTSSATLLVTPNDIPQVNIVQPGTEVNAESPIHIIVDASDTDGTLQSYDISIYDYTWDGAQNRRAIASGQLESATTQITATTASNLLNIGKYLLKVIVTDDRGASHSDHVIFQVSQMGSSPVFNATIPPSVRVGEPVAISFTALPFKVQEYGIGSILIDNIAQTLHQGWHALPNLPNQWSYSGETTWLPQETGVFTVEIALAHPDFPNPIVQTIVVNDIPSSPNPSVTPTPTPWPTPTQSPQPSPTPGITPYVVIHGPGFIEINQTAYFTVAVDNFYGEGELEFTIDGIFQSANSITWNTAPDSRGFVASYAFTPNSTGYYPLDAKVTMDNGLYARQTDQLEVIHQCYSGDAEPWDANQVYLSGDKVIYNLKVYEARFWTRGDNPESTHPSWGQWQLLGDLSCY
ncbi:Chitodextrinase [Thalassocella blandensis]|nr:Chitodextrinase [Thalassocella blandensis]